MDALALPRHGTSLLKLGYNHVGLDDCWQSCTGEGGSFHDAAGQPIINTSRFPSLKAMVQHGHAEGVKVGFYGDNCRCHERDPENTHYVQDANLTESLGFDGYKIDSCGNQRDMDRWASEFSKPGRHDIMVESCGNGPNGTNPKKDLYTGPDHLGLIPSWRNQLADTCPFSFFRVSVDVAPQFESTIYNLNRALPYLQPQSAGAGNPLSRPGCWAYPGLYAALSHSSVSFSQCLVRVHESCVCRLVLLSHGLLSADMLEVGVEPMTPVESRTHFAMWCISSAPLILVRSNVSTVESSTQILYSESLLVWQGFDLHDSEVVEANWDIIANEEALNVSQSWHGHPGFLVKNSSQYYTAYVKHGFSGTRGENHSLPTYQVSCPKRRKFSPYDCRSHP